MTKKTKSVYHAQWEHTRVNQDNFNALHVQLSQEESVLLLVLELDLLQIVKVRIIFPFLRFS